MKIDELIKHLDGWAYNKDIEEVSDYLETIGAKYYDSGIDDGGDEEDEYVMYKTYEIERCDIKLYYSNIDYLVSYICYRKY